MRLIAISIVVCAGAAVTSVATLANNRDVQAFGVVMIGVSGVMFTIEWWPVAAVRKGAGSAEKAQN